MEWLRNQETLQTCKNFCSVSVTSAGKAANLALVNHHWHVSERVLHAGMVVVFLLPGFCACCFSIRCGLAGVPFLSLCGGLFIGAKTLVAVGSCVPMDT